MDKMPGKFKVKGKTDEENSIVKLDHRTHILKLPDTYIGSIEKTKETMYCLNENDRFVRKEIGFIPGEYKIFDEIIVNARDHHVRDSSLKTIKVEINKDEGYISVYNDGSGLEVEVHNEHKVYIP